MPNYKLTIQYEGTRYKGWQEQKHTEATIQGKLQRVLERMTEEEIDLQGSGRTDAGVHAKGQIAHFHTKAVWDAEQIKKYMNEYLPEDIAVLSVEEAAPRFRPREPETRPGDTRQLDQCSRDLTAMAAQGQLDPVIGREAELERMHGNLLRAVSHDIRTPLTSIQASASGILDNYDALGRQEKVELLEGIRDESRWLIRMVENLLSITRINGDRAQLQTTWEVVEEVVGGAVGKFQKQFAQIEVETSMPEEVVMAPMDGILVEQVLVNLMENSAIHGKTTTKIRISIQKLPERVLFCVEDNGKGIDPAILPIIFEGQLPTGDHAASDGKRSMGIGLSVCMSIIQAHQGDMKAENMAAHRGARIQFWLPCQEENWMEEA